MANEELKTSVIFLSDGMSDDPKRTGTETLIRNQTINFHFFEP